MSPPTIFPSGPTPPAVHLDMQQLMFGLMSGVEKVQPYAEGDILVHKSWGRLAVKSVERDETAAEPEVLLCIKLSDGNDCVAFPREILYRSR